MKEIKQIIQAYRQAQQQQRKVVLATVVHIEGSAYRAPGARMLVQDDGRITGAVSGGCLEGDILRKALQVMQKEQPVLITYDTTEDEDAYSLGVSLGCNGIIRILLEPVGNHAHNPVLLLEKAISTRTPAVIATFYTPEDSRHTKQGTYLLCNEEGQLLHAGSHSPAVNKNDHQAETTASNNRDDLPAAPIGIHRLQPDIAQVFALQSNAFIAYAPDTATTAAYTAFLEYLAPAPALIIAGAGNDVLPVVQVAEILGWDITLVDGRPAYASQARFPTCRIQVSPASNPLGQVPCDAHTAILLMTHNYQYDKAALQQALQTNAAYIGILGPAKKRNRLLQELQEEGIAVTPQQEQRIYGPMGLDIGAETPEEIALSIISGIKAVFAQRNGNALRSQKGSIHQRNTRISSPLETYGVLLLAAGQSKRLGSPKQQLMYKGDTLLRNATRTACALQAAATVVVAGENAAGIQQQLQDMPAIVIPNEQYAEGMASSIRAGVQYLTGHYPQLQHILVMLCDQPYLTTQHLRLLLHRQQSTGAAITASYYANRKGVPALFHQQQFAALLQLEGDTGAKHLIEALGNEVEQVAFAALANDIDDNNAYWQLIAAAEQTKEKHDYRQL
ncbi:Xanthine and CO dehydrogenase maturation factor, XdhC/CoxF family [Filimonas lacunae]|uniref:Xanthine and CO dehydrogenase maturation factor, XdhC/CoxF family n=1 Tax=Filimonas lacunae TaxID=477680 RepID=A0A173MHE0_9BACT|nr:XdhC family protein [Filimonas lacunae]BAV07032.1 xanthine and CO dehydrogenases maturation factor, XdhC/CoxF family [Filimonas lacunae]SIS96018.1 Xanthine and CO dehydrogenase maturation factor, XdhC/CoxF family [Filimonas lacunae]